MFNLVGILGLLVFFAFAVPTLIFLLRLYHRTQIKAFLWLIAALIAWPLIARSLSMVLPLLVTHMASADAMMPPSVVVIYGVVYTMEALIGGALLLTAVILLDRELSARMDPALPPLPGH